LRELLANASIIFGHGKPSPSAKLEILATAILNGLLSLVLEMLIMLKGLYNIFWIVVLQFTVSMILPCFIDPNAQLPNLRVADGKFCKVVAVGTVRIVLRDSKGKPNILS
jgi:hypothetical protein